MLQKIIGRATAVMITATFAVGSMLVTDRDAAASYVPLQPFNISGSTDYSGGIDVDVVGSVATFVVRTLTGNSTTSLHAIYFESGLSSLLSGGTLGTSSAGVDMFKDTGSNPTKVTPGDLPSGNTIAWAGKLTAFGANNPGPTKGINPGEFQNISFNYLGAANDTATLVAALINQNGNSRVSGHVLNCDGGESCSVSTVPIPAAVWLLGSALFGFGFLGRRRRNDLAA